MSSKLSPDAKRLRTIIISLPVLIATSAILYRRTYLGEEQRRIPQDRQAQVSERVAGGIGGAPWEVHGSKDQVTLRSDQDAGKGAL